MPELQDIFLQNPLAAQLNEARSQSKRLALHITGIGMKTAIETMDEFETEQKKNLRQKYSRSNRDIFARLHRPIDKVFSASGGSLNINLPESKQKLFNVYLQSIRKSMSLRKWVQQVALPAYEIDPNGLIFIEIDTNGVPYPTYKSTTDIFYYEAVGRNLNMVIFHVSPAEAKRYGLQSPNSTAVLDRMSKNPAKTRYYRIVDAVSDKVVEWDGAVMTEIPELNMPNPFMRCPGIIVSDIYQFNSDLLLSPDSDVVELANDFLTDCSTFNIWKKLHMFPKHWRMQSVCPTCQGQRNVKGETCPDCTGTGFQKRSSVRDEIIVPFPDSTGDKISLPQAFDGYTTPSTDAWDLATGEMDRLYNFMFETLWGYTPQTKPVVKTDATNKTATQVLDESNGKCQKLYGYSDWAESIETFVIDLCAGLMYGSSYKGVSVKYGDRYIMEGPDEIWLKYSDARTKGASQAVLDDLLRDYYESKFYGNPLALQEALKQMRVEPWVHLTILQVQAMDVMNIDKACKTYFSEWASTLVDMDWLQKDEQELRELLVEYCTPKAEGVDAQVKELAAQGEKVGQAA